MNTVLVIDDDSIIRLLAAEVLNEAGYRVIEAATAEAGVEKFNRGAVDLVLLDVILPGMNGFEACVALRRHAAGKEIPIIVMTGLDDRKSIVGAYESGATDFITKPIVWDLLPYRVRYALRASAALQDAIRSKALLARSQTLANMGSWEWICAVDSLHCSEEMFRIQGKTPQSHGSCGAALLEQVHADDLPVVERALHTARTDGQAYGLQFRIVRPDGAIRQVFEQTDVERDAGGKVFAVRGIRRDVTQQTEANEQIRVLAYFDPLTGLANRALFRDMVKKCVPLSERRGMRCAVLVVDLDRFKLINETLGPQMGDEVLKAVSHRLRECLRVDLSKNLTRNKGAEDRLARAGGDEFTVLLVDILDPNQAYLVARRIVDSLARPLLLAGHEFTVNASIGITLTEEGERDIDSLLRNAGTAMHAAKQDVEHRIRFYDGAMSAEVTRRLTIETELRRAIDHGELCMFYQAKVDARNSRIVGAEALIRWQHPSRGLVGPLDFIPVAEESGLIVSITRWVIARVCRQIAEWRSAGLDGVPISINLDAASLQTDSLVDSIASALKSNHLDASELEFEVTESSLMRDLERTSRSLNQLRELGVTLSIDDFGTGYSSLTYLKRFPVTTLKIDRSFVRDLMTDASDAALTSAIIAMGHSLNLQLIAEGVETIGQAEFLIERGCVLAQGYLFAKPLPSGQFAELLRSGIPVEPRLRQLA